MEGMAPPNATHGEPSTTNCTVLTKRFGRKARTARMKAAAGTQQGRDEQLIKTDETNADP